MKSFSSKGAKISLAVFACIVLFAGVLLFLLFSDDFKGSENIANQEGLTAKVSKSVLLNKEMTLNKDELNTLVRGRLEKNGVSAQNVKNFTLIPAQNEDIMYVYAQFDFWGMTFGFNAKTKVSLAEDKLEIDVLETHVGKLPVPRNMVLNYIGGKAGDVLEVDGNRVYFSPDINIKVMNVNLKLVFEKFKVENEKVTAKLKVLGDFRIPALNKYI